MKSNIKTDKSQELSHQNRARRTSRNHEKNSFIRSKIWFLNSNKEVLRIIGKCVACQAMGKPIIQREPLKMKPFRSNRPCERLSADFCGPLPSGDYLFVIIDVYSSYSIFRSIPANAAIPVLDKVITCSRFLRL